MNQLAMGVPLRPSTPQPSGCVSEMIPLALKVVITGHRRRSASAVIRSMLKRAPWPTMITGRSAFFSSVAASSNAPAGGAMVLRVIRPAGPPGSLPSEAGSTCTSSGKIRCDTPRFRIALLHARLTSSACLLE